MGIGGVALETGNPGITAVEVGPVAKTGATD